MGNEVKCPLCGGPSQKRWSWPRYKKHDAGGLEYKTFVSRSTGYMCLSLTCGHKFIKYAKIEGKDSISNKICNIVD